MAKVPRGYIRPDYDGNLRAECRFLFIDKGFSPTQLSKHFGGKPSYQCIQNWAKKKDKQTGLSWIDEREKRTKDKYLKLSPQSQASKLMDALDSTITMLVDKLSQGKGDAKELSTLADSLSKISKTLEKNVDKKIPGADAV